MRGTTTRQTAEAATAIYVRISKDRRAERKGVDRQREDCEALCQRSGWQVTQVYEDNDISASKYTKRIRPSFRELMKAVKVGSVTRIVCWRMDRLYRRPRELEDLIDLSEAGRIEVVSEAGGPMDLTSAQGRQYARGVVGQAIAESEITSERVVRATKDRRKAGLPSGGPAPYGWRTKNTIEPAQSKVLLAAMDDVLKGRSLSDLAREWNAKRIRGRGGWDANIIGHIITRPHHAGLLVHRGKVVRPGTWTPLIDRAKYERLVAAVEGRAAAGAHLPKRRTMLTGLVVCGECGHTMYRSSSDGHTLWRCHTSASRGEGCGKVSVRAALIEPVIVEAAIQRVDDLNFAKDLRTRLAPGRSRQLTKQLEELDRREAEIGHLFAAGTVKASTLEAFSIKAEADRGTWTDQLATMTHQTALGPYAGKKGALRKVWEELSVDTRRTIIRESIGSVTIKQTAHRGKRFDVDRIVLGRPKKVKVG